MLSTLLKFVTFGENELTRRRVPRSTLTDAQWRVAEALIAARLLTSNGDGDDAILDVAHEALFRSWTPLRRAIEACVDQLRWRADVERWARDWENSGRQEAYLLRDERLRAAQRWITSDGELVVGLPLVAEFLAYSNRADRATMQRLSETIARQALGAVDHDPDYSLLLALAAFEECAPTALALRALMVSLVASKVRVILRGHDDHVFCVAWSPEGQLLVTASRDQTARIWDSTAGTELAVLRGHDDWVQGVAWSPDGRLLASGFDRAARIWEVPSGRSLCVLSGHDDGFRGIAWSPDGRRLVTGSRDRTARVWDAHSGSQLAVLLGHDDEIWGVAWSPDGRRLANASNDRTTRIWDVHSGSQLAVLRGHDDWVQRVEWSPEGQLLVTASRDRTARVWDAHSGSQLVVLLGHDDEIPGVAWSPDGRRLVTGSRDRTVRIWNAESGAEIIVVGAHTAGVEGVAWSPDGRRIASASRDGTSRIWDATVSVEAIIARARRRACRELSAAERRNLMLPRTVINGVSQAVLGTQQA